MVPGPVVRALVLGLTPSPTSAAVISPTRAAPAGVEVSRPGAVAMTVWPSWPVRLTLRAAPLSGRLSGKVKVVWYHPAASGGRALAGCSIRAKRPSPATLRLARPPGDP